MCSWQTKHYYQSMFLKTVSVNFVVKLKKRNAIVVSFQNTVLHDIFLYYTDYSNYLPSVRPASFHVDNKMILNKTKTKAMLATGKWIEKRMNNQQL